MSVNALSNPLSESLLMGSFRVSLNLCNGVMSGDGHDFMDVASDVSKVCCRCLSDPVG